MKRFWIIFFVSCTLALSAAAGTLPRFADHPSEEKFTGTPAIPDFSTSPSAKKFIGQIRAGAKEGPNFAGHYTIVDWGCGAECQSFVIVDAKTGAIFQPDFSTAWACSTSGTATS